MSKATKATPKKQRSKGVSFASIRVQYAKDHDLDVAIASKRLRAKIRAAVGKNDVVTSYVKRHGKTNRDGNRYGDATAAEAKALLSL